MANILKTSSYDIFVNDETNRNVTRIKKLIESMKKYGFIAAYPLHVIKCKSGRLKIRDGGHRFEAAKALKIPVYYIVIENEDISIPEINNTQRKWVCGDYVDSFIRSGRKDYEQLKFMSEKYGITVRTMAALLNNENAANSNAFYKLKDGTFKVKSIEYAEKVGGIIQALSSHTKYSKNVGFISAVSKICRVRGFDSSRFIKNAAKSFTILKPVATVDAYLELFEDIYNDHITIKNKIPLKFLATNACSDNNPVKIK